MDPQHSEFGILNCCSIAGVMKQSPSTKSPDIVLKREERKASENCGVGICFHVNTEREIIVNELIPEGKLIGGPVCNQSRTANAVSFSGSAFNSRMIHEGDVLYEIDHKYVYGHRVDRVARLLLGPKGTKVDLGFMRGHSSFRVTLERQPSDFTPREPPERPS